MQIVYEFLFFKLSFANINCELCIFLLDVYCLICFLYVLKFITVIWIFFLLWALASDALLICRFDKELNKEVAIKVIDLEES